MVFEVITKNIPFLSGGWNVASFSRTLIYGLILISVVTVFVVWIRNKIKYQYYGFVFKRRQERFDDGLPTSVFIHGKAGYFNKRRTGKTVFRIKYGKMPWQQIELTKLPNPKYMLGNVVAYTQIQKDNFVQNRMNVDWEANLKLEPTEADLTYGAYLDIMEKHQILKNKGINPTVIGMAIMGLILVTGIIVYYFLGKA